MKCEISYQSCQSTGMFTISKNTIKKKNRTCPRTFLDIKWTLDTNHSYIGTVLWFQFLYLSGLLYHKRTEHFEERPYACEECGAKFAATSSLKNHMRLHTGEKPFHCKHCDMSFSVAAALSYHTKKKHAEGGVV